MADSRHVSDLLPAVVNGSADEAERAAVDAHVASCAACAAELKEWRQIALAVHEEAPSAPHTAAVMESVWRQVDAAAAAERAAPTRGRSSWSRVWRPVWSTAAVLALVFTLLVVERGEQTPQEVLLAAAVRTSAQETARLRVTGSARFAFDSANGLPADAEGASLANLDADISGRGSVRFGEALHVRLRLGLDASAFGVQERNEIVERLVLEGKRYERRDEGDWVTRDDATGMVGLALLDPRLPERVLSNAEGAVHVDGAVERLRGMAVRRYTFDLVPGALSPPPGASMRFRAQVWLGEADGLLHALRIQGTGPASIPVAGRWDIDLRVDLMAFGERVVIPSPPSQDGHQ